MTQLRVLQRNMTEAYATARVLAILARRIRAQAASGDTVGLQADLNEMAREAAALSEMINSCAKIRATSL